MCISRWHIKIFFIQKTCNSRKATNRVAWHCLNSDYHLFLVVENPNNLMDTSLKGTSGKSYSQINMARKWSLWKEDEQKEEHSPNWASYYYVWEEFLWRIEFVTSRRFNQFSGPQIRSAKHANLSTALYRKLRKFPAKQCISIRKISLNNFANSVSIVGCYPTCQQDNLILNYH